MKIYGKLVLLGLLCSTAYADHFADEQAQCQVFVTRTNVRLFEPSAALEGTEETQITRLDLKGVEDPSGVTIETFTKAVRTVVGAATYAAWDSASKFTPEALEYHLGSSPAAKVAGALMHTPWKADESYTEWGTRVVARTAHEFGYISEDTARKLTLGAVLATLSSEDNIRTLALNALKIANPGLAMLAGDEIADIAGKIGVQAPGYVLWLFDEKDLTGMPTATKASSITLDAEEKAPTTMLGKARLVIDKLATSVEIGTKRAVTSMREAFTVENIKTKVVAKARKLFGFGGKKDKASEVPSSAVTA